MTSYPPPPAVYGSPGVPAPGGKPRLRGRVPRILGWVFLGVGIVAVVLGAVLAVTKTFSAVDGFQRVSVADGSGTIDIDRTGKWVGYYEARGVNDGTDSVPIELPQIADPSGNPVAVKAYGGRSDGKFEKTFTYQYHGHDGIAVVEFDAKSKGEYRVEVRGLASTPAGADVAFGEDVVNATTIAGVVLVVVGILLVVAAIVLLIVGYVKRGRHKRELATASYAPPGGYGPPPGGYGPPPGAPGGYGQQGGFGPPPGPPPAGYGDQPGQGPSLQK